MCRLPLALALVALFVVEANSQTESGTGSKVVDPETEILIDTIDAGLLAWREQLNFCIDYQFKQGTADSIEKAMAGDFQGDGDSAKCRFVKLENAVTYRFQIVGKSDFDPVKKTMSWNSFELFSNKNLEAYRSVTGEVKDGDPLGGVMTFSKIPVSDLKPNQIHREIDLTKLSPFVTTGANQGSLLRSIVDSNFYNRVSSIKSDTQIVIRFETEQFNAEYFFEMKARYPRLLRVEFNGSPIHIFEDYVAVDKDGLLFPLKQTSVSGPHVDLESGDEIWVSRIWKSERKSISTSERSHFEVDTRATKPVGLALAKTSRSKPGNFLDLTVDNLLQIKTSETKEETLDSQHSSKDPQPDSLAVNWTSKLMWVGIAIISVVCFVFLASRSNMESVNEET